MQEWTVTEEIAVGGQWRSGFHTVELSSRFTVYNRLQFLRAGSHSVGAHTVALQPATDSNDDDDDDDYYDDEQSTASTATTSTGRRTLLQQRQMNLLTVAKSASWRVRASAMRTRSLLRELCEKSGYARLLSRVPRKHQHGHVYLHVGWTRAAIGLHTDCRRHLKDILWHLAVFVCDLCIFIFIFSFCDMLWIIGVLIK